MPAFALDYYSIYNSRCKDFYGRGRKIRTLDTRFWRPLLYQLSYTPISLTESPSGETIVVGLQGLEPGTNRL